MKPSTLRTDGGSRGNPGIVGLGFSLTEEDGSFIADGGWYLPHGTNNVAEYSALIWGLRNALAANVGSIRVLADSELMVKQINGQYKVKSEDLKPLYSQAKDLLSRFAVSSVAHVYRESNKEADALANAAMDEKAPVGAFLVGWDDAPSNLFDMINDDAVDDRASTAIASSTAPQQNRKARPMQKSPLYTGHGQLSGDAYESAGGVYELTVKDHFDAAHELPGYNGPCRYLHGHTWDVEVTIIGTKLDEVGILYDFKDIKTDLHAILENFDHKYINDVPPFDSVSPTAEHMARILYWELAKMLPSHIELKEMAVWESPNAKLVYRP